jgi:hypothetical protein
MMLTPSEKVIAAMELIPMAHKDELGQRIFRMTVHDLLAAGATAAEAYTQASSSAAEHLADFEPRCNRAGLLALDSI